MYQIIVKLISIFSLLVLFNFSVYAQKDPSATAKHATLSVATGYYTNTSMFGSLDNYVVQPSINNSITYKTKKEFSLIFSPNFIGNSDSTASKYKAEYDLGANYSLNLWEILNFTPAFTHYFYSNNLITLKSGFDNYAELATSLSLNWWTISLTGGYGWGKTNGFLLNPSTCATIEFDSIFGKDQHLIIQPTISFALNNNELSTFVSHKKLQGIADFIKLYPNMTASDFLNSTDPTIVAWRSAHPNIVSNITRRINKANGNGKKNKNSVLLSELFPSKNVFGLTSINISLPISYRIKNLTFSADFQYNKPNNQVDPSEFYVNFGISYTFKL